MSEANYMHVIECLECNDSGYVDPTSKVRCPKGCLTMEESVAKATVSTTEADNKPRVFTGTAGDGSDAIELVPHVRVPSKVEIGQCANECTNARRHGSKFCQECSDKHRASRG